MAATRDDVWLYEPFGFLSRRAKLEFFVAVFFTFAPIALLFDFVRPQRVPWYEVVLWASFSGLTAVGWALAFVRSIRILAMVIPISFALPILFGQRFWAFEESPPRLLLEVAACIVLMALGYGFFIRFITTEGMASLRLRTEMNLAHEIHADLVPPIALRAPGAEVYGTSLPTTEVGGDLLDVLESDGKIHVYVADVSGHGVPAGVFMAMIKSAIRTPLLDGRALGDLVCDLNAVLVQVTRPTSFATFAALQFDREGTTEYALAGHLPVLHFESRSGTLRCLHNEHPPLGIVPGHPFTAGRVESSPGDLFFLYTDGLTEVMNGKQEEFGESRLKELITAHASRPLAEIHAAVLATVRAFGPQQDDQTLVLVRLR